MTGHATHRRTAAPAALALAVLAGGIATARAECPPTVADLEPPEMAACFAAWDAGARPAALGDDQLATVENLEWFDKLVAAATEHVAATPSSKVDVAGLTGKRDALVEKLRARAFASNACGDELVWCLDREGNPVDRREVEPRLFAGDRLVVLVLSHRSDDKARTTITSRTTRAPITLFAGGRSLPAGGPQEASTLGEVARLQTVVGAEARAIEVIVTRTPDASGKDELDRTLRIPVQLRQHLVEFGVALVFVGTRDVTGRGAVEMGIEPDLAFTVSVFPGRRQTGEPLQPARGWVGAVAGADVTSPVREKRYYVGVDFSPVGGLALDLGLAVIPWEYVPNPEDVPDVMAGDIEPVKRYRPSYFIGLRLTSDVFKTAKAAYAELRQEL